MCKTYEERAIIYLYRDNGWKNGETGKVFSFHRLEKLPEQERRNATIYLTYDNGEMHYHHSSGFCVNEVEGYIYYFAQ